MGQRSPSQIVMHVSRVTLFVNILLSALKFAAGILAHSSAMVSDAIHSASDVFSTLIVMIGVKCAGKAPDREHPYGHERMECVAELLLAAVLLLTGIGIGYGGLRKIIFHTDPVSVPGGAALAAAICSILVKEAMFWYTRAAAQKTDSGALMADAWHHRSDAFSSVGSLIGILGARMGVPILDPAASILICVLIAKAAIDILRSALRKMTDHACDGRLLLQIRQEIEMQTGVLHVDAISTRLFGNRVYVDVEIQVDKDQSLSDAHAIAHGVHDAVECKFPKVKHCMVHVNPG